MKINGSEGPGWSQPPLSKKWHYFAYGDMRSLCCKWLYAGYREDEYDDHPENCVICKRKVAALRAQAAASA